MASTYVNDLRLNEMATGDGSGTWGTTTNTNLELIAEAFSYGTEAITTNADTHTTTIADGATDPGRSLYLKYTGTLDSACTITIGPNTVSKVWIIENGTSGSQDIIISQGSGANITIPAGDTKVVYSDGAGAGAAFFDAFASLSVVDLKVQDDLTVTDDASIGGDATITGTLGVTGNITGTLATAAQTNITSVGTLTALDVSATTPIINLQDSNGAGNAATPYLQYKDSGGTDLGYVGYGSSGNSILSIVNIANDSIDFLTNGTQRLRINSSGNVSIGSSFASGVATRVLTVDDPSNAAIVVAHNGATALNLYADADEANIGSYLQGANMKFFTTPSGGSLTERVRIASSGNVGIGESSPSSLLHLSSSAPTLQFSETDVGVENYIQASGGGFNFFADDTDAAAGTKMGFFIDGSELMRIAASGNLLVGTTYDAFNARTNIYGAGSGTSEITLNLWNGGGSGCIYERYVNSLGSAIGSITQSGASAVLYNTTSDQRLKENITDANNAGDKIDAIKVRQYDWKADGSHQDYGMIAQELVEVAPEAVSAP
jgi:hypothetical protein